MEPVVKKQRVRAKNVTPLEVETLKSAVMECFTIITSKHCNGASSITKKTQDRAWASICDKATKRSISEVKERWRNLTKKAKTEITNQKKSMGKTGVGPPILTDLLLEDIASLYQDSAAFHGIPGATDAESTFTFTGLRNGVSRNGRQGYPLSPNKTPFSKPEETNGSSNKFKTKI